MSVHHCLDRPTLAKRSRSVSEVTSTLRQLTAAAGELGWSQDSDTWHRILSFLRIFQRWYRIARPVTLWLEVSSNQTGSAFRPIWHTMGIMHTDPIMRGELIIAPSCWSWLLVSSWAIMHSKNFAVSLASHESGNATSIYLSWCVMLRICAVGLVVSTRQTACPGDDQTRPTARTLTMTDHDTLSGLGSLTHDMSGRSIFAVLSF